jgi:hypothetical protein
MWRYDQARSSSILTDILRVAYIPGLSAGGHGIVPGF